MENVKTYEDYKLNEECEIVEDSCISERCKKSIDEACNAMHEDAIEYHDDTDDDHTYDVYLNECMKHIGKKLGI
jgi:hypothetical protein